METALPLPAVHPGEILTDEFLEIGGDQTDVAAVLGVSRSHFVAILSGKASITADIALRLGHYLGTSAEFWLNLQTGYDLDVATAEHGEEIEALPVRQVTHYYY
jgi:antitoxin HigA-1